MTNDDSSFRRAGWLSVICGAWNAIAGFMFGFGFIFASFDMGSEGYDKVGALYKTIAHNISWFGMFLFAVGAISSGLLIVGGVLLLLNRMKKRLLILGLSSIYLYFACFGVMAFLLSLSGGSPVTALVWVAVALVILTPSFFLHKKTSSVR